MRALGLLNDASVNDKEVIEKYNFDFEDENICLGLVNLPDIEFDCKNLKNNQKVLIKIIGFSLNYRDLGIIISTNKKIGNTEEKICYPVGSDFVGEVIDIGGCVYNLDIGDRVIGNNFFADSSFPNSQQGIPSNHGSTELQVLDSSKLLKINSDMPDSIMASVSIGLQTAMSMIRKSQIKNGDDILIASVTSSTAIFIMLCLKNMGYKNRIFGLSTKSRNWAFVKNNFNLKDVFFKKNGLIDSNQKFDVVMDPFADENLPFLFAGENIHYNARIVTCGIFAQTEQRLKNIKNIKLTNLVYELMVKNVSLIGNCLGTSDDLSEGLKVLSKASNEELKFINTFSDKRNLSDFISNSFNLNGTKFGKSSFLY